MLCLVGNTLRAQHFFNKREMYHSFSCVSNSSIEKNNKHYILNVSLDNTYFQGQGQLPYAFSIRTLVLNQQGDILYNNIYHDSSRDFYLPNRGVLNVLNETTFVAAVYAIDDSGRYVQSVLLLDTFGNVLQDKELTTSEVFNPLLDFVFLPDHQYLVTSNLTDYTAQANDNISLKKLDSSFNIIWQKQYGHPTWHDGGNKILVMSDGYILVGILMNVNLPVNSNQYIFKPQIIKVDTGGNVMWTWRGDTSHYDYAINDIVSTPDGGYLYAGQGSGIRQVNGWTVSHAYKSIVVKLDAQRQEQWRIETDSLITSAGYGGTTKILPLPNDEYILVGTVRDSNYTTGKVALCGFLIKMNGQGQVLWNRHYLPPDYDQIPSNQFLYDVAQTGDGGFVMVGECRNHYQNPTPTQRSWILKVDSLGCLGPNDPQCQPVVKINEPERLQAKVKIYPNPGQEGFTAEGHSPRQQHLQVYNLLGQKLRTESIPQGFFKKDIVATGWPQGLYLVEINGEVYRWMKGE